MEYMAGLQYLDSFAPDAKWKIHILHTAGMIPEDGYRGIGFDNIPFLVGVAGYQVCLLRHDGKSSLGEISRLPEPITRGDDFAGIDQLHLLPSVGQRSRFGVFHEDHSFRLQ